MANFLQSLRSSHPHCLLCLPLPPPSDLVQGVAMSITAYIPFRFFAQTPLFWTKQAKMFSTTHKNNNTLANLWQSKSWRKAMTSVPATSASAACFAPVHIPTAPTTTSPHASMIHARIRSKLLACHSKMRLPKHNGYASS